MKRPGVKSVALCFFGLFVLTSIAVHSSEEKASKTDSTQRLENWGKGLCTKGKNQSPIDIKESVFTSLDRIYFRYSVAVDLPMELDNRHVVFPPGNKTILDYKNFELQKMYLRIPSEHLIKGRSFAMEAQLLHKADDGQLLMVALLFELGKRNAALAKMFESASSSDNDEPLFKLQDLLPRNSDYYRYNGSLTQPPCTEGVRWIVMKSTVVAEQNQIEYLQKRLGSSNNRPSQPLNARVVMK